MAHTNSTTHYALPQFLSTDKPAWLTDVNPAYEAIDTAIYNAKSAADAAQGDATQALSDASSAGTTASTADAKGSGAIASISESFDATATYSIGDLVIYNNLLYKCIVAVTTPGPWTGVTNWQRTTLDAENGAIYDALDEKADVSKTNAWRTYDDATSIGIIANNQKFTASYNGFVILRCSQQLNDGYAYISHASRVIGTIAEKTGSGLTKTCMIPIKAGEEYTFLTNYTACAADLFYFY